MSLPENDRQHLLVTHALLTGLTPLVPIPFVDDQLYAYFMRSMVQRLATLHTKTLTAAELEVLVGQPSRGALGCLGSVLFYPLKKVLRKVFFFLELKRAVDTIIHTYYQGYLIDVALAENWLEAHSASQLRAAINAVLARTNTSVVTRAIAGVVKQSKGILQGAGELLTRSVSGTKATPDLNAVARAAASVQDSVQDEDSARLGGLTSQLQRAFAILPAEHFQQLRHQLAAELARK